MLDDFPLLLLIYVVRRTDEAQKSSAYLNDTLADPESSSSLLPQDAPFQRAHGCSFFEYYETVRATLSVIDFFSHSRYPSQKARKERM